MRHDVARRVQFGTALVHSMDGITASQWTCLARARDTEKANSYQSAERKNERRSFAKMLRNFLRTCRGRVRAMHACDAQKAKSYQELFVLARPRPRPKR